MTEWRRVPDEDVHWEYGWLDSGGDILCSCGREYVRLGHQERACSICGRRFRLVTHVEMREAEAEC